MSDILKVLIVDDSRIFRGVIEEALVGRRNIQVVGSVWSGEKAIELAQESLPDFVTLDVEMPGIGGIGTLKRLRSLAETKRRPLGVLLVSAHTREGAAVTIDGLHEGAFDFISKPDGPDHAANSRALRDQLIQKIEAWQSRRGMVPSSHSNLRSSSRSRRGTRFRAVVIGASTGGPEALTRLLPTLAPRAPVPIFLVQHFPPSFSDYFASSLSKRCGTPVVESAEGVIPVPGTVYLARGGKHLVLEKVQGQIVMGCSDAPPENGCRPAVDVLFRSAAVAYSGQVLAAVLTGMGNDGAKGAAVLRRSGGHVIAQDETTSVVWGMPGSVVEVGAADEVLAIDEIASVLLEHLGVVA
jgi:two-component system chemotaxis response regulator CheB